MTFVSLAVMLLPLSSRERIIRCGRASGSGRYEKFDSSVFGPADGPVCTAEFTFQPFSAV